MTNNEEYPPFEAQAEFYDLIYSEKQYEQESQAITQLIRRYSNTSQSILSIGCGTGRYELELAKLGFKITALDRSKAMLEKAQRRLAESQYEKDVTLILGEAERIELTKKFDVVTLLFCVINYMNDQNQLVQFMKNCTRFLAAGGLVVFDTWHRPAVEKLPPQKKEKNFKYANGSITRSVEPLNSKFAGSLLMRYSFSDFDLENHLRASWTEDHDIRPLGPMEIRSAFETAGLTEIYSSEWPNLLPLADDSWNALWIARKEHS